MPGDRVVAQRTHDDVVPAAVPVAPRTHADGVPAAAPQPSRIFSPGVDSIDEQDSYDGSAPPEPASCDEDAGENLHEPMENPFGHGGSLDEE